MTRKNTLAIFVAVLLAGTLLVAGRELYSIYKDKATQNIVSNQTNPTPVISEVEAVIQAVSNHIVLPTDEEPALATIEDKNKLTTQFLSKSENGDKILLYQQAQRAIIYRPSIDKIIDIGPLSIVPVQ